MNDVIIQTTYFARPGKDNTERVLQIAKQRADELSIRNILVATTTGATGVRASQVFKGYHVVVVSHSAGFQSPNTQELTADNRAVIEANGGHVLTAQHALGGVGRAVRKKLQTYELEEILAFTLRIFGQGTKVVCEISLMAADAGLVPVGDPAIVIAGTGRGADTAVVLKPTNAQDFFDLQVMEVLCKPGLYQIPQA